jgi:Zn finger protein HypA/HybF involved in hydrogenase expression
MWIQNRNKGGAKIMTLTIIVLITITITVIVLKTLELALKSSEMYVYDNNIEYTCTRCTNYFKLLSDEVILFAVCPNCGNAEGTITWEQ